MATEYRWDGAALVPVYEFVGRDFLGLTISAATANGDDGNVPGNVIDGDTATRWSHNANPSLLTLELGLQQPVGGVQIWFYNGNNGDPTNFDIETSTDGSTWTLRYYGRSSGTTLGFEEFRWPAAPARFVRYRGYGRSASPWNSIVEAELLAPSGAHPVAAFTPTTNVTASSVTLSWAAPRPSAAPTHWNVFAGTSAGSLAGVLTNTTNTSYQETGLSEGTTRHFRVEAVNTDGTTSATLSATTTSTTPSPTVSHGNQLTSSNVGLVGAGVSVSQLQNSTVTGSTANDQIIEYKVFTGYNGSEVFTVTHDRVTIRYCRFEFPGTENGLSVQGDDCQIEWCEFDGISATHTFNDRNTGVLIRGGASGTIFRRNRIMRTRDAIHLYGDNSQVIENYTTSLHNPEGHIDGIHIADGNNNQVLRNHLQTGPAGSAVGMHARLGPITNLQVRDNFLEPGYHNDGSYPWGLGISGAGAGHTYSSASGNITITGNYFKAPPWQWGTPGSLSKYITDSQHTWSGNYLTDSNKQPTGSPVPKYV